MTLSADYTYSCTANRFVFILTSRLNRMQNDMPRVGRAPVNNSTVVTPVPGASRRAILTGLTSAALAAVTGAARATLYLSVAKVGARGDLGGGREPVVSWGERARV